VPVEITESMAPVIVHRKEYRIDSGGAGMFRGGLGQVMEIESAEAMPFAIATAFDRMEHPARGVNGGGPGMVGQVSTTSGRSLSGKGHYSIQPGERLIVEMPGGGGYGVALQRDPSHVARDVRDGRLSAEAALAQYGVVLSSGFVVDAVATQQCRQARGDERPPP
jgi:N-methylhydantoinase B